MKRSTITSIALFAALVVSSAANAASYDYTAHYTHVGTPALTDAQNDAQLQADTVSCDGTVGVQRAAPSASYRGCMLAHGWKYNLRGCGRRRRKPTPISVRTPRLSPVISSTMITAWTARKWAAPRSAIPLTERCIISTRIRTCRAHAPARCPSARTSEHQDRMGEALSAGLASR